MLRFYITAWEWDGADYVPKHITACDDYESIRLAFDSITVNKNRKLVELWECREDTDERIDYHEWY